MVKLVEETLNVDERGEWSSPRTLGGLLELGVGENFWLNVMALE